MHNVCIYIYIYIYIYTYLSLSLSLFLKLSVNMYMHTIKVHLRLFCKRSSALSFATICTVVAEIPCLRLSTAAKKEYYKNGDFVRKKSEMCLRRNISATNLGSWVLIFIAPVGLGRPLLQHTQFGMRNLANTAGHWTSSNTPQRTATRCNTLQHAIYYM